MIEFANREKVIKKLIGRDENVIELYGNWNGGKTSTVDKAAKRAIEEGKIGKNEYKKIEIPVDTDREKFVDLLNKNFPGLNLTVRSFNDNSLLENYFNNRFSSLMLFFDNTENFSLGFSESFTRWLLEILYPSLTALNFKKVVLAGRVPLNGYPTYYHNGKRYPLQIYLGPIEHEFVAELMSKILKVQKEDIPFGLLRDLRFVTAGIPKPLKNIIKGLTRELPDSLEQSQLVRILGEAENEIKEKMVRNGLDENVFNKFLAQKLFSLRAFDEFGLFESVFEIGEKKLRNLRESLYKARFITKRLLKKIHYHYSSNLTDPGIRWILSANAALKDTNNFKKIEEKLITFYERRIISAFESKKIKDVLKWFCEWLYHLCLLEAFVNYPPHKDKFLEVLDIKIKTLTKKLKKETFHPIELPEKDKDRFVKEFYNDDLWWILDLFTKDKGVISREITDIIRHFVRL